MAAVTPPIGERNYCVARATDLEIPPTVFRCTELPVEFATFVVTTWVLGRIMVMIARRFDKTG